MTWKTVTRKNGTAALFGPIHRAVAALALGVWRLAVAIKHRRELAHLADLDDHMLADISLTRSDLRDAYSEPLWRDPTSLLARRRACRTAVRQRHQPKSVISGAACRDAKQLSFDVVGFRPRAVGEAREATRVRPFSRAEEAPHD
jgi:uncharacterized protein YjiS (DUF1127 family)